MHCLTLFKCVLDLSQINGNNAYWEILLLHVGTIMHKYEKAGTENNEPPQNTNSRKKTRLFDIKPFNLVFINYIFLLLTHF